MTQRHYGATFVINNAECDVSLKAADSIVMKTLQVILVVPRECQENDKPYIYWLS